MRTTRGDPRSTPALFGGAGTVFARPPASARVTAAILTITALTMTALAITTVAIAQSQTAATVEIRSHEQLGAYLATTDGSTLYAFVDASMEVGPDRVMGGDVRASTPPCSGACSAVWPPYLTEGPPRAARGLDAAMLGRTTRDDGTTQVVFNGWPLYTFVSDRAAGNVAGQAIAPPSGQAFEASWFLVAPDGTLITDEVAQPAGDDGGRAGGGDDSDDEEEDDGGGYY